LKNNLLVLVLQNLVLFPNQEIKLEMSNNLSKSIIKKSLTDYSGEIVIVSPKEENVDILNINDVQSIGSFCKIKNPMDLPNGNIRITLRGIKRINIEKLKRINNNMTEASIKMIEQPVYNLKEELVYSKKLKELVEQYVEINSKITNNILGIIKNVTNLSKLTDMISASLEFSFKERNKLFKETNYYKRAKMLITMLSNSIKSLELENKIEEEVRTNFEKSEKEIIIREKIKSLSNEIGLGDEKRSECDHFLEIIDKLKLSENSKIGLIREVKRFEMTLESSPEYGSLRSHLEFITSLPWDKSSKEENDIKKIESELNEQHYGLEKAKARIEEYVALRCQNKGIHSPVLCLIGPPGTGKTTFAKKLATSIKREFVKVSVGGLNDSSELVGHRRTYIGAGPGKIMEGIRKCGVNNPVILIDEIDKMVKDYKGDPSSILLDILDQSQNKYFVDNYVQEPFDLSNVLFILTANDETKIPRALYDRLEVIEISSYTLFDKIEIAKNHTLPNLAKEYNYDNKKIKFTDDALTKIITEYTKESGVRDLERKISTIIRKILLKGFSRAVTIKESDIENYLGEEKYIEYKNYYSTSGVVNIPAYTSQGGCILNVETSLFQGPETIISTGSLGHIMQESIKVVLSYLKSNTKELKLDSKKLSESLHVHALDGSTPKDGPSAGLGIAISIVSLLKDTIIPNELAFTGEMTLKGRILKVGGIKEKMISAYNSGIKKIYIPEENLIDIKKVPQNIVENMEIVCVNNFIDVYSDIFSK